MSVAAWSVREPTDSEREEKKEEEQERKESSLAE